MSGEFADINHGGLTGQAGANLSDLCLQLPKLDLHCHLEGGKAIEPEILIPLAKKYGIPLPSFEIEELRPRLQVTGEDRSLLDFLKKFETIGQIFVSRPVIKDITYFTVKEAARENVKYLELRFSPYYMAEAHQLGLDEVMRGVTAGVRAAQKKLDIKVNMILIVERQKGPGPAWEVEKLAEKYKKRGVVALDLANDEFNFPPGPYADVFLQAKRAGLGVTVHAGEAAGAENVLTSIEKLGADRIGHGTRTFEDPVAEELVLQRKIPLEVCLTSNVQTQAVASLALHPFCDYFRKGILVTLNTDDPGVSGISMSSEVELAVKTFNLRWDELKKIILNSVEAAFLSPAEKTALYAKISSGIDDTGSQFGIR